MNRLSLVVSLLALAAVASAVTGSYRVTQSVGSLSLGQPGISDPYLFLDFQLSDGKGLGNGNSSVSISNLSLSGGTIDFGDRRLDDIGNVIDTSGGFILTDGLGTGNALADRAVLFRVTSPTAVLTYDFTVNSTGLDAPTPDGFNVALLYRTGPEVADFNVVRTLGPTANEMVNFVFDGGAATRPTGYAVDPIFATGRAVAGDLRFGTLGTPVITAAPVPEPSAFAVMALGLVAALRRRK